MELQVIGSSLNDIREVLGLEGDVIPGQELVLPDGSKITVADLTKSSGFEVTTIVITAIVSVVTGTSSAILSEWLKTRLFGRKDDTKAPAVTVMIDGKTLEAQSRT